MSPTELHDIAAERAVLGAIILDNAVLANVQEWIVVEDFSNAAHADIFNAMVALDQKQQPIDPLTLGEQLKVTGKLARAGGPSYIGTLDQAVPFSQNASEYAKIIKSQATRRALASAGQEMIQLAHQQVGDIEELVDEAERRVFHIAEKRHAVDLRNMQGLVGETLDLLERMKQSRSGITGIGTGFIDLDNQLTGLHGGELIVIAARPGIGKTSLGMNIAIHVAQREKLPVAIFSLEMPAVQLVTRMLATHARIDVKKLRGGRLLQAEEERINDAASELYGLKMYIDDSGSLSSFELRAKARRLKQQEGNVGLIIVDYLQLMHQKGKVENRQLEVAEISRALKQLAKELDTPIIALSQLNRKVEERKHGRPLLSDLRESGAIEQDADVVLFIHRDDEGEEGIDATMRDLPTTPIELIVAKQRNGPVGKIDLIFVAELTRFESRAHSWQTS